jgi:hypothetical protein
VVRKRTFTAKSRSKFAALHRQWWRLHISERFLSGTRRKTVNKIMNQSIESHFRTWVPVLRMRSDTPMSRVAVGVALKSAKHGSKFAALSLVMVTAAR